MSERDRFGMTDEDYDALLSRTRRAQGLPDHIEDEATLDWLAGLLVTALDAEDEPQT